MPTKIRVAMLLSVVLVCVGAPGSGKGQRSNAQPRNQFLFRFGDMITESAPLLVPVGLIKLDIGNPPGNGPRRSVPPALGVNGNHVVHPQKLRNAIASNVVSPEVPKVEFHPSARGRPVEYTTNYGTEVEFPAKKPVKVPVHVKFTSEHISAS